MTLTNKVVKPDRYIQNLTKIVLHGQQHQQFRALGLGQRPFLDAPTSFRSHLRELESFGRNKHHHHHSGSHLHDQQTGNNVTANSVSGACTNPNNTDPTASPASSTHLGATGGSSAHQDCYKRSPQHGEESLISFKFDASF
ncbi:protein lozenge-like protein [Lasius niger]|uniref:Protein lozenge-like protein n=1 Tax=Lasius niger TaxID=67767 RepID=A0A0J7L1D4_LASNI|nr:protein lozenge-like protein [Lasius niger]